MPFDPYALCPGGRDKKIRFCCPNMLKELEQVVSLLESGQPSACLSYVETLEKTHPDCACLTKAKLSIYRSENRWQEALPVAEQFYAREPDNPTAAAEYALALVVTGNPKLAISTLVDAFERTKADTIHSMLLQAALQVATYSLLGGLVVPAIGIGHVLKEIPAVSEKAHTLLFRATSETEVPLLLRDWSFDFDCPSDFPGKETFDEAAVLVRLMRWKQALALLESLTQHADAWSGIWHNIATICLWLLEQEKACEALKTYASLPNTPMEDAVDAETLRLLFTPNPLGDSTEMLFAEYTITDADKALEILLSSPLFQHVVIPPHELGSPPPRGFFMVLDRPFPEKESGSEIVPALENLPVLYAIAVLFGKETDREARLLLQALPMDDREVAEGKVRDALGDIVQFPGVIVKQASTSKTRVLAECRVVFPPSLDDNRKLYKKLSEEYHATRFIDLWISNPLGLLDGKTPSEAAKDTAYTIPLLAAIRTIELWINEDVDDFANILRTRLGLPVFDTIAVADNSDEDALIALDAHPVWRWHRFDVSKLSTEVLASGMQVVLGMRELRTAAKFAEELLSRPMDSMAFSERFMALEALIAAAQTDGDIEQALLWVERGKSESAAKNVPDAAWYLHEIELHLIQNDSQALINAIEYLMANYKQDDAVMGALQELFVRLGMLNPDGTPSAAWTQAQMQREEGQLEGQKIWTPDSEIPGGGATLSKLWVPD